MKTFFLSFPRLHISLTVPDEIAAKIQRAFFHSIRPVIDPSPHHEYVIRSTSNGLSLIKDGQSKGVFESWLDLICRLEEDIENTLVRAIGNWVGFHGGAVMIGDSACVIPGNPDTGKTTTTFNLIEMGHMFLCEEVCPVDPRTLLVYPYPQVLSMDKVYAKEYLLSDTVEKGELTLFDLDMARYRPFQSGKEPLPLKTIILPAYDPSGTPGIENLSPGDVLTELLGYCFPPNTGEEYLFDSVIRICEQSEIFRIRTNDQYSMRKLLTEIFS